MAGLQGRVFGGFQLTEQMSGGGIADVYRARSNKPGAREVVVKVIYPEFARQPGFLPHFREIVQSSARLASHPHILPLIASGEEQGYLYLVTPYVSAGALRDRMRSGGQLGAADIAPFFRQLCDALVYAHSLGVHHDNVKPSNIFLFEGRHVLLGDFGLLWNPSMMDMDQSASGAEAVEFLAPEILRGPGSQQADIYGVGAVLFAAVTGHAPFHGSKLADIFAAHANQAVPHLAQINPSFPPAILALDPILQRAMAKRPEDRYPSAAALAQAIETAIQHATPNAPPAFPMGRPQPMAPGVGFAGQPAPPMPGQWPAEAPLGANGFVGGPIVSGPMMSGPMMSGSIGAPGVPPALGGSMPMGFGQLNPPFPPLPGSAGFGESEAGQPEIGNLPTARVPAPGPMAGPSSQSGDPAALATIYSPAAQMGRVMASGELGSGDTDDGAGFGPLSMPAVRPGAAGPAGLVGAMSNPGFMVAGGSASWNADAQAAGDRNWNLTGPLGDDRFDNGTAQRIQALSAPGQRVSDELSEEQTAWRKPEAGFDPSELLADGNDAESSFSGPLHNASYPNRPTSDELYSDEYSRAHPAAPADFSHRSDDRRPFSATQLELPRLTSPALEGMPPSWQDIVTGQHGAPASGRQSEREPWSASGPKQRDDWRDESAAWQAQSTADGWEDSRIGESVFAPAVGARGAAADMPWDADASAYQPVAPAKPAKKGKSADQDYLDFDDDRVWTTGHTAIKHKRRRRVRRLVVMLVLLLAFDMAALLVSRPDLCPTSGCRQLSGSLHQRLPLLDRLTAPSALAVGASPTDVKLTVAPGQSAHTSVTVTNMGALATTEQVSSSLTWISADPASSALTAGSNMQVTITARPPANLKIGVYTATVTISNDKVSAVVTLTIAVSAGS